MDYEKYKGRLSIDTFYSPRIKEEEIFVRFDEYTKLVTREFLDKDEMFKEEEISSMLCNKCDKPLEVIIDWFSDSGRTYSVSYTHLNVDKEALHELADSIKQFGIIQPIVVQKKDDYYEIIAGERRWRAAKLEKLKDCLLYTSRCV